MTLIAVLVTVLVMNMKLLDSYLFEIIPGKWFYALKIYFLCSYQHRLYIICPQCHGCQSLYMGNNVIIHTLIHPTTNLAK